MREIQVKKAVCMWCHCHCKVAVSVRDGQLLKIEEDREHPRSTVLARTVRACPRALAAAEWFHHPDRLSYPLKRVGERGQGRWAKVSWEQALDEIAEKLSFIKGKYGPEAVVNSSGTYRTHHEYAARFFNLFGSPNNIRPGQICHCENQMLAAAIIGHPCNTLIPEPGVTKCILLVGTNPAQASRRSWYEILDTIGGGARLIVVDPRYTQTAERADMWLQLRPGTDGALLMGMTNVIINEELYDKEFVEKWCHGFHKLTERVRDYSPEKVADITWISAEKIKEAARMYATNRPAVCFNMMGVEHVANQIETLHVRFILPAITGNIDVRGGDLLQPLYQGVVPEYEITLGDKMPAEQKSKLLGGDLFRLHSWSGYGLIQENMKRVWGEPLSSTQSCLSQPSILFRAILTDKPYPVRAMITLAGNPMVINSNTKLVYGALKRLDFHVVMDFWMTPTAELADYVLPSASWLERPCIRRAGFLDVGEASVSPVKEGEYERRTDYEFWRGLGIRLGQAQYWPWNTLEEAYDYQLAPIGYTLNEFVAKKGGHSSALREYKKYEKTGFATPTGKLELYSTVLEGWGYDALPHYEEPPESPVSNPELAVDYPLILITGGRFLPMYHSEHRQINSLRKQHPEPVAQLNPQKAAELGIDDGEWIWIETPRGKVRQKCQYFKGIDPRVVHAEHGWWFPELPGEEPWLHGVWESNINVVTEDDPEHCNKISGGWPLRALLCKVYKVENQ